MNNAEQAYTGEISTQYWETTFFTLMVKRSQAGHSSNTLDHTGLLSEVYRDAGEDFL